MFHFEFLQKEIFTRENNRIINIFKRVLQMSKCDNINLSISINNLTEYICNLGYVDRESGL
jgi:hypothetical protein